MTVKRTPSKVTKKPATKKTTNPKAKVTHSPTPVTTGGESSGGELAPNQFYTDTAKDLEKAGVSPFFRDIIDSISKLMDARPGSSAIVVVGSDQESRVFSTALGNQCQVRTIAAVANRSIEVGMETIKSLEEQD